MNKHFKHTIIGAIASLTILSGVVSYGLDQPTDQTQELTSKKPCQAMMHRMHKHWQHHRHIFNLGLNRNKNLNQNDAKVIIQAALLLKGRKDLHVGDIQSKESKRGHAKYLVQIDDQNNQVISTVVLNSRTGHMHPLRHHEAEKIAS
jgi:hypothetical protein